MWPLQDVRQEWQHLLPKVLAPFKACPGETPRGVHIQRQVFCPGCIHCVSSTAWYTSPSALLLWSVLPQFVCCQSAQSCLAYPWDRLKLRLLPTCRKKRLFATQSLTDLLRKEGVDAASLTLDAQGHLSQLSSLLGLEVFDDIEFDSRRPEEWVPPAGQADTPPSPAQVLVVDQEGRGSWELAKVLAWDRNTAKYRAQLDSERTSLPHAMKAPLFESVIYHQPACIHQTSCFVCTTLCTRPRRLLTTVMPCYHPANVSHMTCWCPFQVI